MAVTARLMIGCFPDPYPDELLYSLTARYAERVGYNNATKTLEELFGTGSTRMSVDFPLGLDHLINALPPGHAYTVEDLIYKHTLLPFYGPFLPPERTLRLMKAMREKQGKGIHWYVGVTLRSIQPPEWLRFCPECTQEDRRNVGEAYWHRSHQLPGAEVCPQHQIFLESSSVRYANRGWRNELVSADHGILRKASRPIHIQNKTHALLLQLAENINWLLTQPHWSFHLLTLKQRYLILLHKKGLASYGGKLRAQALRQAFGDFFSFTLLDQLQCALPSAVENWVTLLLRVTKTAHHPLRHLLMMQFLANSAQQFFTHPWVPRPFGVGPYPCLNAFDDHYHDRRIIDYEITPHTGNNKVIGTFRCSCDFVYTRTGPDRGREDQYKLTRIIARGTKWDGYLVKWWNDPSMPVQQIADRLGIARREVKRHAARLGLDFEKRSLCAVSSHHATRYPLTPQKPDFPQQQQIFRQAWLQIRATHPEWKRKELRQQWGKEYHWLWTYDRPWLVQYLPPRYRTPSKVSHAQTDWTTRDPYLARQVKGAADRLRYQSKTPVRLTVTAIGREVGQLTLIYENLHRLPLTAQALAEVVETPETFLIRRIWWTAQHMKQDQHLISFNQFVQKTGISRQNTKRLPIHATMLQAYESIQE